MDTFMLLWFNGTWHHDKLNNKGMRGFAVNQKTLSKLSQELKSKQISLIHNQKIEHPRQPE